MRGLEGPLLRGDRSRVGHRMGLCEPAGRRRRPRGGRRSRRRSPKARRTTRAGRWPKEGVRSMCSTSATSVGPPSSSRPRWPSGVASTARSTRPGVASGGPVHLLPNEEWERVLRVNLTGTYLVAKHVVQSMLDRPNVDGPQGVARHGCQHRGPGGNRRRERLQRVQGRRGPADQEHGHRLRRAGDPGQRGVSGFIDTPMTARRLRRARVGRSEGRRHCGAQARAGWAGPRRSPRPPLSCSPTMPRSSPAMPCRSTAGTRRDATTVSPG